MSKKNLKLIMELIFIFILPLIFMCFTSEIQVERNFEYDNNGNYEICQETKNLSFDNSIIKYTKQEITTTIQHNDNWLFNETKILYIKVDEVEQAYGIDRAIALLPSYNYTIELDNNDNLCFYEIEKEDKYDLLICNKLEELNYNNEIYYKYSVDGTIYYNVFDADLSNFGDYAYNIGYYEIVQNQTNINTIWGNIKNIVIDYLDVNDNVLLDILLCYLFLWFFMFLIWHTFYRFFDWIFHLSLVGGRENG